MTPPIEREYNPGDTIRNLGPSSTYTGSILAEGSSIFFALEQKVGQGSTGLEGLGMKNEKRFLPGCYMSVPFGATCLQFLEVGTAGLEILRMLAQVYRFLSEVTAVGM